MLLLVKKLKINVKTTRQKSFLEFSPDFVYSSVPLTFCTLNFKFCRQRETKNRSTTKCEGFSNVDQKNSDNFDPILKKIEVSWFRDLKEVQLDSMELC